MKNSALLAALVATVCAAEPTWQTSRVYGLGALYSLGCSPDGSKLLVSGVAGTQVLDVATWTVETQFLGHLGIVYAASWSPDQSRIATASEDSTVGIWDASTGARLSTLSGHTGTVYAVAWSPDGTTLASASADATVRLWDAGPGSAACR